MANQSLPSPEVLRKLFDYDPETGSLTWAPRTCPHCEGAVEWERSGRPAFGTNQNGYLRGTFMGRSFSAHRVIWTMMTGVWPEGDIDHINGIKSDNRWANLREVSESVNLRNCKLYSNNKSGHVGVRWSERERRWFAQITVNGKRRSLGSFTDKQSAIAARKAAEAGCGFTKRHGTLS